MAEYKVLLTTSGLGSRLGNLTKFTNKSLVRIGKKPAISYIIELYPIDTEFVVSLGYYGDQVKQFLSLAYPDRNFTFVDIENYNGPGSSLLYSMYQCKDYLQNSFIFHACDTVVEPENFNFDNNWVGGCKQGSSFQYRTLNVRDGTLIKVNDKGEEFYDYVYIGICGIKDYDLFWKYADEILKTNDKSDLSDCHVINKMMDHFNFSMIEYKTWYDIGNVDSLKKSRDNIPDRFHLLDKDDESIFLFDPNFVIKFFYDEDICKNRISRLSHLQGVTPKLLGATKNFYKYEYLNGEVYSQVVNSKNFKDFLHWSKENLWIKTNIDIENTCKDFYFNKTHKRISKYLTDNGMGADTSCTINSKKVPSIFELINKIDVNYLASKDGYKFHGDFILENVISSDNNYYLIDWRQDFGGDILNGDIYYDLAKLKHNLTVNHDIIDKKLYQIDIKKDQVKVDILRSNEQFECVRVLENFVSEMGLDNRKVDIIKSLIWINMAPLHKQPISDFLFYFGKYNLYLNL